MKIKALFLAIAMFFTLGITACGPEQKDASSSENPDSSISVGENSGLESGSDSAPDAPSSDQPSSDEPTDPPADSSSSEDEEDVKVTDMVDFVVEVEENKDPVVLQLTDPQIVHPDGWWGVGDQEENCYTYIRETVQTVQPDLILVTGDLIYGTYDKNGEAFLDYVAFMETLNVPWAPVFGNHDQECEMGADWQCDQLENAENCLFKQRELTGNGNYSVGIVQGDELKRVFYMLDSNGCSGASAASLANGHTQTGIGFGSDQIAWYTQSITALKEVYSDVKISFAYHIQQAIFQKAYEKYGFTNSNTQNDPINIDLFEDKTEGDFGYIGRDLKGPWDTGYTVWNGMKALGVDSIFVGHEHCNSASVVYEGVRFQFGQKSSRYDRINYVHEDGTIEGKGGTDYTTKPLLGGTVIPLSSEDGSIKDPYIYFCEEAGGDVVWSDYYEEHSFYGALKSNSTVTVLLPSMVNPVLKVQESGIDVKVRGKALVIGAFTGEFHLVITSKNNSSFSKVITITITE